MNCKPGDLAYVRGVQSTPELNGNIVEILAIAVQGEQFLSMGGHPVILDTDGVHVWRVRARNPLPWNTQTRIGHVIFAEIAMRDSRLIPISGVPVHDEVTEEITA